MSLILDEDESFSMQAYMTTPGYSRTVLRGYIRKQTGGRTYIAPLLPQLFYGWSGAQLSSWRQYIGATGSQTILSRSGGLPTIPTEEMFWREVTPKKEEVEEVAVAPQPVTFQAENLLIPILLGGAVIIGLWAIWK